MGFRTQLALGLAIEIMLVVAVCVIASAGLGRTARTASEDTLRAVHEVLALQELRGHTQTVVANARGYLLTGDAQYLALLETSQAELERATRAFEDPHHAEARAKVLAAIDAYVDAVERAVRERHRVTSLASLEALYERGLAARRIALDAAFDELQQIDRATVERTAERTVQVTTSAMFVVLVASTLAVVLSILLGVIVARRLAEQFRRVQEARQAASDAAAERRELLDIVSHDLRSPLTTMALGVEALRDDSDHAALRPLENAVSRMQRLVDDLLAAARAETVGLDLQLSTVDTNELLALAADQFSSRAEHAGVELRIEHASTAPVRADRDRVLQILSNLVGNAVRVTPRGGTVIVTAEPAAGAVRFAVRDSGPGVDAALEPQLFDAYRQGAKRGSLGLGLYIAKSLVSAHGGKIGVERGASGGSTFWFELPAQ